MATPPSDDIHIRLPRKLKRAAQKIIEANGLDISSVIRLFFTHITLRKTIPLQFISTGQIISKKLEDELVALTKSKNFIGPFDNAEDAIRALHANPL